MNQFSVREVEQLVRAATKRQEFRDVGSPGLVLRVNGQGGAALM